MDSIYKTTQHLPFKIKIFLHTGTDKLLLVV